MQICPCLYFTAPVALLAGGIYAAVRHYKSKSKEEEKSKAQHIAWMTQWMKEVDKLVEVIYECEQELRNMKTTAQDAQKVDVRANNRSGMEVICT